MECMIPGRVLISPSEPGLERMEGYFSERIGIPVDIDYSIADLIRRYELPEAAHHILARMGPLPLVARVPEGQEDTAAERLVSARLPVAAACPDYLVRSSAAMTINPKVVGDAIAFVGAPAKSSNCGTGCRIAVLDTGVDTQWIASPKQIHPTQYDTINPYDKGRQPSDLMGHGSLVAHIVHEIAPAAEILSIKTIGNMASVSGVLAGLYLAQSLGFSDVINLSLSVSCSPSLCKVCKTPATTFSNAAQLSYLFQAFLTANPDTIVIAAAGNGYPQVAMPAVFPDVIAVGDFDMLQNQPAAISQYTAVPVDRYILAPGSGKPPADAYATAPSVNASKLIPFHGTSFATAVVTGVAARLICGLKGGPCYGRVTGVGTRRDQVKNALAASAQQGFAGYSQALHGLGLLHY